MHLNRVLETLVLEIPYCVLIEPVYNIIVNEVIVRYLNVLTINKESFEVVSFWIIRNNA